MSNGLLNAAGRIRWVRDGDTVRSIRMSEKAVLVALANDARDAAGGRSRLGPAELGRRATCSLRSVRYALAILAHSGHITRERCVNGLTATTRIHPDSSLLRVQPVQPLHVQPLHGSGPEPVQRLHGSSSTKTNQRHEPRARADARDFSGVEPEPPAPDPADAVFDAWDAMTERAGLPGPVTRTVARRAAIERRLGEIGRERVLALVWTVGASDFLKPKTRRSRDIAAARGQSHWMASIDHVFETGPHFAAMNLFARLLDGEFGQVPAAPPDLDRRPVSIPATTVAAPKIDAPPDPPEFAALREQLCARTAGRPGAAELDALRFELDGPGELIAVAPGERAAAEIERRFKGDLAAVARAAGWRVFIRGSPLPKKVAA